MKLINESTNGQIFFCPHSRIVHVEFGNLFLRLSFEEFNEFVDYVNSVDHKLYLQKNSQAQNRRKLLLNIGLDDAFLTLTEAEFLELKGLLTLKQCKRILTYQIHSSTLHLN